MLSSARSFVKKTHLQKHPRKNDSHSIEIDYQELCQSYSVELCLKYRLLTELTQLPGSSVLWRNWRWLGSDAGLAVQKGTC